MRILFLLIIFLTWLNQLFIIFKDFSLLGLVYLLILSYSFLILSGMLDFKKFVFKSLILPTLALTSISILAHLGIYNNQYIYLLFIVVVFIPFLFFQTLSFKKEYLINLIEDFIDDTSEAKIELLEFKNIIAEFNKDKNNIPELTENDEQNFINSIKKYKIYIVKKALFELFFQGINEDANILVNYVDEKYYDILNENDQKFFSEIIPKISSGDENMYQEGVIRFYNYMFLGKKGFDISLKISSYSNKNIIIRLQEKNMKIFFTGIGSVKIS